jgi:hypothetical protein
MSRNGPDGGSFDEQVMRDLLAELDAGSLVGDTPGH